MSTKLSSMIACLSDRSLSPKNNAQETTVSTNDSLPTQPEVLCKAQEWETAGALLC